MLLTGSSTVLTPKRSAASGISCISPWAFLGGTAARPMKIARQAVAGLVAQPLGEIRRGLTGAGKAGRESESGDEESEKNAPAARAGEERYWTGFGRDDHRPARPGQRRPASAGGGRKEMAAGFCLPTDVLAMVAGLRHQTGRAMLRPVESDST